MTTSLISFITAIGGYTPTLLIGTLIGSGVVLLVKKWVKFPERLIPWIWICLIFSSSFLGVSQLNSWHKSYQLKHTLINLTPGEKEVLQKYLTKNVVKFYSKFKKNAVMIALEKKGIIYKAYDAGQHSAVYNINQFHFDLLKKNPEWVELNKQ